MTYTHPFSQKRECIHIFKIYDNVSLIKTESNAFPLSVALPPLIRGDQGGLDFRASLAFLAKLRLLGNPLLFFSNWRYNDLYTPVFTKAGA